jgi:squalene synthase HpnC
MSSSRGALGRAYHACERLARAHYENFPVASRLLPAAMRPSIAAVYAFARVGDDIADEGHDPPSRRIERLHRWQQRLHEAVTTPMPSSDADSTDTLIVHATADTIRRHRLPLPLFDDLISAFAQDITIKRYQSWPDLLDYCRRSANPVGRLVLKIGGYEGEALMRSSDALCTALQLTNFWQDFARDWEAGRLYVPRDVMVTHGAEEKGIAVDRLSPEWVSAVHACVRATEEQFQAGRAVCDGVSGRLRFELRATWVGGRRILDRVRLAGAGLPASRPALTRGDVAGVLWQSLRWGSAA